MIDVGNNIPNMGTPLVGATYAGDKIYSVDYYGDIYEFDPATGDQVLIWQNDPWYIGIAFDGSDFYVNTFDKLYTFDMSTGEATLIGEFTNLGYTIISISFDGTGNLWGIDTNNDVLHAIDKETAETTVIGSFGEDFIGLCDISFDKSTNVLYLAGTQNITGGLSQLYIISTETGNASPIGQLQDNVHLYSLATVSDDTFMFAPENLSATSNGNDAVLTWEEPFGGNAIEYNVYRDDALIGTTTETGFVDAGLEIGFYAYTVTAVYDDGESDPAGPVEVAIGNPELTFDPESIDAVLEMGEATTREVTLYNDGNLDLEFNLTALLNPQSLSNPTPQQLSAEAYNQKAIERFGNNWQELRLML